MKYPELIIACALIFVGYGTIAYFFIKDNKPLTAPKVGGYSKLQYMLLSALMDYNINQIHEQFFQNGLGIGHIKRYLTGRSEPHPLMLKGLFKRFPEKYHKAWDDHVEYTNSFKGW